MRAQDAFERCQLVELINALNVSNYLIIRLILKSVGQRNYRKQKAFSWTEQWIVDPAVGGLKISAHDLGGWQYTIENQKLFDFQFTIY